jgi:hypothetical protein
MTRRFKIEIGLWLVFVVVFCTAMTQVFGMFAFLGVAWLAICGLATTAWVAYAARRLAPSSYQRVRAAALTVVFVLVPVLAFGWFGTEVLAVYGYVLFLGLPALLGFLAPLVFVGLTGSSMVTGRESVGLALVAGLILCSSLLVIGVEGLICLAMAMPLVLGGAVAGSLLGWLFLWVMRGTRQRCGALVLLVLTPCLMGVEAYVLPPPPVFEVRTEVVVDAPPEVVWEHVVSFAELPPPTDWLFDTGIAYPLRAEIDGEGVGAIRRCVFSTGALPITVWDPPRRLAFDVVDTPPPLEEWNPLHEVHPPHLEGFMVSERGEFRLEPLTGGGTRLVGTTFYRHSLWPARYWEVWSEFILHRIHLRVLRHIAREAAASVAADHHSSSTSSEQNPGPMARSTPGEPAGGR